MEKKDYQRLVIISNRLPISIVKENNEITIKPSSGGLVSAMEPILRNRGGVWIGWSGSFDIENKEIKETLKKIDKGYTFENINLTPDEVDLFYHGFSNEVIWPLFHDLITQCHFLSDYWEMYLKVNKKYAETIIANNQPNDFIWVHDYQLMYVGSHLRQLGSSSYLSFFLHIPFPAIDIYLKLPWRFQIIRALLEYDLIGFQTQRDLKNFIQCVRALVKEARFKTIKGMHICFLDGREIRISAFPIGIDYKQFAMEASTNEVAKSVSSKESNWLNQKLILSVDRLDYSKGIPLRLSAIRLFLEKYPSFHKKVVFLQVVIPSRVDIPKYQELKEEIDRLVGEINSKYTNLDWVPIHYMFTSIPKPELLACYRLASVGLITPIKDGMNLVAKEFIASNTSDLGVLVLSEFAGAAAQMHEYAIMVNPFDEEITCEAIFKALTMEDNEKRRRMRCLKKNTKKYDIYWWVSEFLKASIAKNLQDFPIVNEYIPRDDLEIL